MHNTVAKPQNIHTRKIAFILGTGVTLISLIMPMDTFGIYHMFTAHMTQHLLLALVAPPLFILSISSSYLHQFLERHRYLARILKALTKPLVASALFNGNLWIWHAPLLLQATMDNMGLHVITNTLYILTGLLFWWPLLNPVEDEQTLSLGGKLAYLFFSDMPMMLLGAGMTFSRPLYSFSMTNPSMQMAITAEDQQLGGLLMWVVGSIFFIILASIFFLRWMLQLEKDQQAKDRKELLENSQ